MVDGLVAGSKVTAVMAGAEKRRHISSLGSSLGYFADPFQRVPLLLSHSEKFKTAVQALRVADDCSHFEKVRGHRYRQFERHHFA
jgi:hypothetical protein